MKTQLPLHFNFHSASNFNNFTWGKNIQLRDILETLLNPETQNQYTLPQLYISGKTSMGKTHLLQACCKNIDLERTAIYLPLKELLDSDPEILEGIESQDLIAIDDLDLIAQNKPWEEALFHLYNRARSNNVILLFAGTHTISNLNIKLPDLRSRLQAGLSYNLHELTDLEKIETLKSHAQNRGIKLSNHVSQFILNHYSRDMHTLEKILGELDKLSLIHQRKISIHFLLQHLNPVLIDMV